MHSLVVVWHLIALAITSIALCSQASKTDENWQLTRLLQPSQAGLLDEKKGKTVIHDGLTAKAVNSAPGWRVDRIDAMTSTGVVVMTPRPNP